MFLQRVKLLEHGMKVIERLFEHGIQQQVKIDDMPFGFVPGKCTTHVIFVVKQLHEKWAKDKNVYFGFVDLEKAFYRVPGEVIHLSMRKLL